MAGGILIGFLASFLIIQAGRLQIQNEKQTRYDSLTEQIQNCSDEEQMISLFDEASVVRTVTADSVFVPVFVVTAFVVVGLIFFDEAVVKVSELSVTEEAAADVVSVAVMTISLSGAGIFCLGR